MEEQRREGECGGPRAKRPKPTAVIRIGAGRLRGIRSACVSGVPHSGHLEDSIGRCCASYRHRLQAIRFSESRSGNEIHEEPATTSVPLPRKAKSSVKNDGP
jgi:hypothetical protein